ncbi:hypothetical protein OMK64_01710 [Cellulomonas fimi]|uniref:hypothetical protein n=1 Tax=Cellulomonas fimi TaxID=1708 RepID=UPI00234E255C|nr:hypothetical protein [Cellulomonas fimi]MDC7120248.1 hypothetical protein [Cellulomonas fimi]
MSQPNDPWDTTASQPWDTENDPWDSDTEHDGPDQLAAWRDRIAPERVRQRRLGYPALQPDDVDEETRTDD